MDMAVNHTVPNVTYLNQGPSSTGTVLEGDESGETFDVDVFLSNDVNENTKAHESTDESSQTEDDEAGTEKFGRRSGRKKNKKLVNKEEEGEANTNNNNKPRKGRGNSKTEITKKPKGRTKRPIVSCSNCRESNRPCDGKIPCAPCVKANKQCRLGRGKLRINMIAQREGGEVDEEEEKPQKVPRSAPITKLPSMDYETKPESKFTKKINLRPESEIPSQITGQIPSQIAGQIPSHSLPPIVPPQNLHHHMSSRMVPPSPIASHMIPQIIPYPPTQRMQHALHNSALHNSAPHNSALHNSALHTSASHNSVLHNSISHNSAPHNSVLQNSAPQNSAQTKYTARRTTTTTRDPAGDPGTAVSTYPLGIADKMSNIKNRLAARQKKGENVLPLTAVSPPGGGHVTSNFGSANGILGRSEILTHNFSKFDNSDKNFDRVDLASPTKLLFSIACGNKNSTESSEVKLPKMDRVKRNHKRLRSEYEGVPDQDSNEGAEVESEEDNDRYKRRPKRQRKRTESVQRAIEEELEMELKRKGKSRYQKQHQQQQIPDQVQTIQQPPPVQPEPPQPLDDDEDEGEQSNYENEDDAEGEVAEEESIPDDGVLGIDKFLLKRYNTLTAQAEYLVQWNGYDIHRSAWIAKKDIFAADYLSEFEAEWAQFLGDQKTRETRETEVGDKVWVKLKGHQWWPAQVVVHSKPGPGRNDYTVVFYGDNTFAFVNDYTGSQFSIEPFEGNTGRFRKKANEKAVQEALAMLPDEPE